MYHKFDSTADWSSTSAPWTLFNTNTASQHPQIQIWLNPKTVSTSAATNLTQQETGPAYLQPRIWVNINFTSQPKQPHIWPNYKTLSTLAAKGLTQQQPSQAYQQPQFDSTPTWLPSINNHKCGSILRLSTRRQPKINNRLVQHISSHKFDSTLTWVPSINSHKFDSTPILSAHQQPWIWLNTNMASQHQQPHIWFNHKTVSTSAVEHMCCMAEVCT